MSRPVDTTRRYLSRITRLFGMGLALALLSGCDENGQFSIPGTQNNLQASTAGETRSTRLVERDVEAPEVFSATDEGLWDGRPSLGGVWVAHPDVTEPERVIIRNEANGKFVIGALFRKERDLPGPKLQISSDAAAALDILAGAPAPLNVTALRRQEAEEPAGTEDTASVEAPAEVSEATLDPIASAGAAIDATPATAASPTAIAPSPESAAPRPAASSLAKPFVQIGIFSIEANATRVGNQMRSAGMIPVVKESEINGKPFWRVLVGPATTQSELNTLVQAIKTEGFSDAYAVSN